MHVLLPSVLWGKSQVNTNALTVGKIFSYWICSSVTRPLKTCLIASWLSMTQGCCVLIIYYLLIILYWNLTWTVSPSFAHVLSLSPHFCNCCCCCTIGCTENHKFLVILCSGFFFVFVFLAELTILNVMNLCSQILSKTNLKENFNSKYEVWGIFFFFPQAFPQISCGNACVWCYYYKEQALALTETFLQNSNPIISRKTYL